MPSYACADLGGAIWVKGGEGNGELPRLERDGWAFGVVVFNKVQARLELVIDNFSEVEHTVATHPDFGFDPARSAEAVVEVKATPDSIAVTNQGPAKMPPLDTRLALALRPGDHFHSDYTFRFDPPRSSVTHRWSDPATGCERMLKYHVIHYFVPEDDTATTIVTFAFLKTQWPLLRYFGSQMGWLFRRKLRRTVDEDAFLVENLADKSPDLEGMRLGRFDSILFLTRERLHRIYYEGTTVQQSNDSAAS